MLMVEGSLVGQRIRPNNRPMGFAAAAGADGSGADSYTHVDGNGPLVMAHGLAAAAGADGGGAAGLLAV